MWDRPPTHEQLSLKPTPATPSPCQFTFFGSGRASCTSIGHSVGASEPVPTTAEPHSLCLRWDPTRLGRSPSLRNLHVCHKSDEGIFKSKAKGKIQTILYNVYSSYGFCFMAAFSAIAGFSMQPLSSRMAWVHTGGNRPHFRAGSRLLGILKPQRTPPPKRLPS